MGALRRPQFRDVERQDFVSQESCEQEQLSLYPRWIVVPCVVLYCTAFWVLVWAAGSSGVAWVRAAAAGVQ